MPATVFPANSSVFGISGSGTTKFQSRSVATKLDKKEATDSQGEVIGWAFYGKMADHSIEILGTDATAYALGAAATAPTGVASAVGGTVFCVDELSIERQQDGFTASSVKVSEYFIED